MSSQERVAETTKEEQKGMPQQQDLTILKTVAKIGTQSTIT
jgi:hypothetical protein